MHLNWKPDKYEVCTVKMAFLLRFGFIIYQCKDCKKQKGFRPWNTPINYNV